jgi:YceI-like domain
MLSANTDAVQRNKEAVTIWLRRFQRRAATLHPTASTRSKVEVHGILRLHGADHETTLTARVSVSRDQLSVATNFVVPYVKWGLKNPSTFILRVSQEVDIDIHAVGRLTTSSSNP